MLLLNTCIFVFQEVPSAQEYGSTVHPSDDHTPVGSIVHATRQEDDYHQVEDLTLISTV